MKLTVLGCGHISCDRGLLFEAAVSREMTRVPVTCFVVEHPGGVVLWDTGVNRAVRAGAMAHWGGVAKRTLVPVLGPVEDVVERDNPDSWVGPGTFRVLHEEPS